MPAVLFDMDGVVIDSEELYQRVQERELCKLGVALSDEDYLSFKGMSEEAVYDVLENKYGVRWDRQQVRQSSREMMLAEFRANLKYVPGFPAIIDRIKGKYKLGLVTSTDREFVGEIDTILPVTDYFPSVIAGDEVSANKPDPEPFQRMMEILEVEPAECVVIEDSINGVRSGKAAGAAVIGLSGTHPGRDLPLADRCVSTLDEISTGLLQEMINGGH